MSRTVAALYPDWAQYAAPIRDGVRDLTPEQLATRAGPEHAPIWAPAAHPAQMRVYWLCGVCGSPARTRRPGPTR